MGPETSHLGSEGKKKQMHQSGSERHHPIALVQHDEGEIEEEVVHSTVLASYVAMSVFPKFTSTALQKSMYVVCSLRDVDSCTYGCR